MPVPGLANPVFTKCVLCRGTKLETFFYTFVRYVIQVDLVAFRTKKTPSDGLTVKRGIMDTADSLSALLCEFTIEKDHRSIIFEVFALTP